MEFGGWMSKGAQTVKPEDHGARRPRAIVSGLSIDSERFHEVERLAAYQMANALLLMETDLQRCLGLRTEERQVFFAIVLETVQRFARASTAESPDVGNAPLPVRHRGHISRRRIAKTLGIPLETVRRHVARLIDQGLVAEPRCGQLSTGGGTLARLTSEGLPLSFGRSFLSVVKEFDRLGVLTQREYRKKMRGPAPSRGRNRAGHARSYSITRTVSRPSLSSASSAFTTWPRAQ